MLISGQAAALVSGNGRQECHLSELLPAASGGVSGREDLGKVTGASSGGGV